MAEPQPAADPSPSEGARTAPAARRSLGRHVAGTRPDALERLARSAGGDAEQLRREVSLFRLALDSDLAVAAAAVDADVPALAAEVLDQDRAGVQDLERQLLARVARAPRGRRTTPRRRRTAAVVVAAALVGAAGGAALAAGSHPSPRRSGAGAGTLAAGATTPVRAVTAAPLPVEKVLAQQQLATAQATALAAAARAGLAPDQLAAATVAFTASVGPLLSQAPGDPAVARQLWQLLVGEQTALRASDTTNPGVAAALAATQSLLAELAAAVPAAVLVAPPSAHPGRPTPKPDASSSSGAPRPSEPSSPSPSAAPSSPAGSAPSSGGSSPPPFLGLPTPSPGSASHPLGLG